MKIRCTRAMFLAALLLCQACIGMQEHEWSYGIEDFAPAIYINADRVTKLDVDENPVYSVSIRKTFPVGSTVASLEPFTKKEIANEGYSYLPETEYSYEQSAALDENTGTATIAVTFAFNDILDNTKTYAVGFHLRSSNEELPVSEDASGIILVIKIGDEGTRTNPYRIYNISDLQAMSTHLTSGSGKEKCFRLMNDIDMAGVNWTPLDPTGERPIFFDGGGHVLKNFTCVASYNSLIEAPSFFAYLWGTCQNLTFENPTIVSYYKKAGVVAGTVGLVGWNRDHEGHLKNVHVIGGSVTHYVNNTWVGWSGQAGGLAGELCYKGSTIEDCSSSASVSSDYCAGGLVGQANDATAISRCYSSGDVTVSATTAYARASETVFLDPSRHGTDIRWGIAGGLVGVAYNVAINDCYTTGAVKNTDSTYGFAGGIVGMAYKGVNGVERCYSTSDVTGTQYAGGIIGTNGNFESGDNHINSCMACNTSVKVRTSNPPGRICGRMSSQTTNGMASYGTSCYARDGMLLYTSSLMTYVIPDDAAQHPLNEMNTENHEQYYQGIGMTDPVATARDILGWDSSIWDLSGDMPLLKQ